MNKQTGFYVTMGGPVGERMMLQQLGLGYFRLTTSKLDCMTFLSQQQAELAAKQAQIVANANGVGGCFFVVKPF